ncbi:PQQ-binding-like beta-propeller repeat protein [Kitasatospora sp. NPDC088346]|uniref:outer membrane protein assembly factor BamB family protein n=1 Tax=Kitasatospora sp. NPDC088346 TaxID=3364073 RepID=UPI003827A72F
MAQDQPPTSDQGYPHDATGQQPVGYDQQAWYPQQTEAAGTPWTPEAGYQQPYAAPAGAQPWQPGDQWETAAPQQQPDQSGYYTGYPADSYGYQAGSGYPGVPGNDQQLYAPAGTGDGYGGYLPYEPSPATEFGTGYPDATPAQPYADPAQGYTGTEAYAGTDQGYTGTEAYAGTDQGYTGTDQAYPGAAVPARPVAPPQPVGRPSFPGSAGDADAEGTAGRTEGPAGPGKGTLIDRARAAAGNVVSGEHAPSRRALLLRAGAGVAALAVLVTAGVLVTGEDGDPGTAAADVPVSQNISVAHERAWAAQPAAAPADGTDDTLVGSWLLADAVVRADGSGVQAYGLADGKPTWSVPAPAAGAVPCGLSQGVNAKGLGAVLFRPAADPKTPCTMLSVVDTKTGKGTWTKTLSESKDPYTAHVAVTDDKVIAIGEDRVAAWAAEDGKDLWQYAGQGKFCTLSGGAGGATVVLHSSCADSAPVDQAVALNANDGKVTWWRGLNNQPKTVTVLSAEPAAVLTTGEKPADDRVFAWGPTGDPAAEIPVTADGGRLDVTRGTFDAAPAVYFHEHTMIATVGPADGGAPAVVAYDLTTGKSVWRTAVAEKSKSRAVGLDAGGLLLAVDERLDQPAHISRFALAGGQETQGGAFPQGTGSLLTAGRLISGGDKVVAVPEHANNFGVATAFRSKG